MSELQGKSALVTGGTSGIGRAAAVALAGLGAHVVISGRDVVRGDRVVADIRAAGGRADFLATDRSSFVHGAVLPVDGGRIAV